MGSLGCPLCCQQSFGSVGALRDHLIYYIYRPLQCGLCNVHVGGLQEFTNHLECHMGEGLPSSSNVSCPQHSSATSKVKVFVSLPNVVSTEEDNTAIDTEVINNSSHLTDSYTSYMEGNDTSNQLLKLREWQLEKSFSRHRFSFSKSPGKLELSPMSGKMQKNSPLNLRDPVFLDGRPSSLRSYTPSSDVQSLKDIVSSERCDSSAPPSVTDNLSSVGRSDYSVGPQSVEKEPARDLNTYSPTPSSNRSYSTHPLNQTNSGNNYVLQTQELGSSASNIGEPSNDPKTSVKSSAELLHKSVHLLLFESEDVHDDIMDTCPQPESDPSPTPFVCNARQGASCSLQSSRRDWETLQDHNGCVNSSKSYRDQLQRTQTQTSSENIKAHESENSPIPEPFSSAELIPNPCTPSYQSDKRSQFLSSPVPVPHKEQSSVHPGPRTSDLQQPPSNTNSSLPLHKSSTLCNQSQVTNASDSSSLSDLYVHHIQSTLADNEKIKDDICHANSDNVERNSVPGTYNKLQGSHISNEKATSKEDVLKEMGNYTQSHVESTSASFSHDESQNTQDTGCGRSDAADTKPYLHKKFHHDQERKVVPTPGVSQIADVSRYINNYQSMLVSKLNGTLSNNIPLTSNMCSASSTTVQKETIQVNQCFQEQPHQSLSKEYTCEVCHLNCKGRSAYKSHYKGHEVEGEKNFFCQFCGKFFFRKSSKDLHERKHTGKKVHRCDQCSKVFTKVFSFNRHQMEVHALSKSFICAHCNKAFSSERHLQEHKNVHKNEKMYKCHQCHHFCHTASGLRTHILEIHSNSRHLIHSCDECGEKFAKIYGLKRHKQRKHTNQQLVCSICSKQFSCKEDFDKHRKSHLNLTALICENCNKTFTTSWALNRHSKVHQISPKPFKCNKCSSTFTRKDSLLAHQRAHAQRKPFVCHCGKRFVKKSQLKEHQDKHSSIPKYACSVCKHSFKFKVSLKNHSCKKTLL